MHGMFKFFKIITRDFTIMVGVNLVELFSQIAPLLRFITADVAVMINIKAHELFSDLFFILDVK